MTVVKLTTRGFCCLSTLAARCIATCRRRITRSRGIVSSRASWSPISPKLSSLSKPSPRSRCASYARTYRLVRAAASANLWSIKSGDRKPQWWRRKEGTTSPAAYLHHAAGLEEETGQTQVERLSKGKTPTVSKVVQAGDVEVPTVAERNPSIDVSRRVHLGRRPHPGR